DAQWHENDGRQPLRPKGPAEENPPEESGKASSKDATHDSVERSLGHESGEKQKSKPLEEDDHYAWPQARRPAGSRDGRLDSAHTDHTRGDICLFPAYFIGPIASAKGQKCQTDQPPCRQ